MKRVFRGRTLVAALVTAAFLLPTTTTPGVLAARADRADIGACTNGWQELEIPEGSLGSVPTEAVTYGGSLAWVLGTTNEGVLSLRWNGERLVPVDAGPGKRRGLASAVAKNRTAVLGVGFRRPHARQIRGVGGRLAGQTWVGQPLPQRNGAQTTLADMVKLPSGKLWAVGASLKGGTSHAMALRREVGTWRNADPAGGKNGSALLGVTRSPGGVVWAVGWQDRGNGKARPLIARRRGSSWSLSGGAAMPGGTAVLTDLAFRSGNDGWAVGYLMRTGSSTYEAILERWNGKSWRRVPLPWAAGPASIPRSISVAKDGSLLIGGAQLATDPREDRGFVAQRQAGASTWKVSVLDTPDDLRSVITAVTSLKGGAVAVGTVGHTAFAMQTCGPGIAVAGGRRIQVGKIKRRRKSAGRHLIEERGPSIDVASPGTSVRLATPVAPSGFVIRDVAADVGLGLSTRTWGATIADFDGDGWKDVLISRHLFLKPLLALGGPNGFTTSDTNAFSVVDRHGCESADVDGDDRRDVLCVTGRVRGSAVGRHELSLAPAFKDGRLVRGALGLSDPFGRGRRVAFIRLDKDRYPEVFITNQPEREDSLPAPNRFFRNVGGRFVAAPEVGLDMPAGGNCAKGTDVDGDGDQDLLHCQDFPSDGRPPGLRVYQNRNGVLVGRSVAMGVRPIGDIDVVMANIDGDGRRDLIQLSSDTLRISRRTASGFKKIYQLRLKKARAVAAGDVNGDGRDDLYVVRAHRGDNRDDILLVNSGKGRAFTSVKIPQAGLENGNGDDVVAIDHDRNGLTDFLVLNGDGDDPGPIQLLASFRKDE